MRRQKAEAEKKAKEEGKPVEEIKVDKVYMIPKNGLFHWVLYPHYFCEWVEWAGFWMVGGWDCVPARCFLINEISSMLPRAVQGWYWYVEKFGRDKVGSRKAIIPGIL
jgi:3-oxo-5-alpha-steroid 4-dehydrogenase 1